MATTCATRMPGAGLQDGELRIAMVLATFREGHTCATVGEVVSIMGLLGQQVYRLGRSERHF